jgi:hypothetical protein
MRRLNRWTEVSLMRWHDESRSCRPATYAMVFAACAYGKRGR